MAFLQIAGAAMAAGGGLFQVYQAGKVAELARDEAKLAAEHAGLLLMNARAAAELERLNAARAESDAAFVAAITNAQAFAQRQAGARASGTIMTRALASGVELEGSVVDALAENAFQNERAVRIGIAAGQKQALALREEAQDRRVRASVITRRGAQEARAAVRTGRARARFQIARARGQAIGGLLSGAQGVFRALG